MGDPVVSLQEAKDASAGSTNGQWRGGQQSAEELTSEKRETPGMV